MYVSWASPRINKALTITMLAAAAAVAALPFGASSAGAAVLVASEDLPVPASSDFVVADVLAAGQPQLVVVGGGGVFVLAPEEGATGWTIIEHVPPLPAPATSVVAADFIGDGVPSLAVGTAQAGAIYLLRWTGTDWVVAAQTGYLWSPVTDLEAIDLSGDGRPELVAVDDGGGVTVFTWSAAERALVPVWQWPRTWGKVVAASSAELDAGAPPKLVVADEHGRISVWAWPLAEPSAQAFVWGTPTALTVADVLGTGPQVVVSTVERLLYRFLWEGGRLVQASTPLHDARLPFSFMTRWRQPGEAADRVLAHNEAGLGVWRVTAVSIVQTGEGWSNPPMAAALWPGTDTLLLLERTQADGGVLRAWSRMPADYFRFVVDGRTVTLSDPPQLQQERVMLSVRDWAAALGLQLYWDQAARRITVVGRGTYAMLTIGEPLVTTPAGIRSTTAPAVLVDGRTYVPPEFPTWFGASYQWDPRRRELSVTTGP